VTAVAGTNAGIIREHKHAEVQAIGLWWRLKTRWELRSNLWLTRSRDRYLDQLQFLFHKLIVKQFALYLTEQTQQGEPAEKEAPGD